MPYDPAEATRPAVRPPLAPTPRRHGPRRDHLDPRGARFLDPGTAVRFDGQRLQPTAYAGAGLLVRPGPDGAIEPEVLEALRAAAAAEDWALEVDPVDAALVDLARRAGLLGGHASPLVVRVALVRTADDHRPRTGPDAWPVLQHYRAHVDRSRQGAVQLQHLLTTAAEPGGMHGNPYVAHAPSVNPYVAHPYVAHAPTSNPYVAHPYVAHPAGATSSAATAEYAQPGWGGRAPVRWVGPRPARLDDAQLGGRRRPVVAVLDTGTGRHPWLDDVVDRAPTCAGLPIGLTDPTTDLERLGVVTGGLTGSLDIEAGHGTFIAGLVHQRCPDARILSVRVVQPDGVIDEYDVLQALNMLWVRQALALAPHDPDAQSDPDQLVDVVSLSLGYYHEDPADAAFDPLLLAPLQALARLGVLVVTSAGNDATSRPIFPASFAPHAGGVVEATPATEVPLVAVGALNPDGTAALFSNDGPWVRAWRPGAAIVSTLPVTFDGGQQASSRVPAAGDDGVARSTIDPDNFSSGFATWSGTSFAAPILAGDLAQRLLDDAPHHDERPTVPDRVEAGWRALRAEVPGIEAR